MSDARLDKRELILKGYRDLPFSPMSSSKEIISNGRSYAVILDTTRNVIVITNSKGEAIEATRGNDSVFKISVDGNRDLINLESDPSAPFFVDLLDKAWGSQAITDEARFFEDATAAYEEDTSHLNGTLNIVVIGKVSSGKSSLINALLMRSRLNPIARVGVEAGVTTNLKIIKLDENVRLIDSPGIDDIKRENSDVTRDFLANIDVGILVITGAANESQKDIFEDLKHRCSEVFVVLNKIDIYDEYTKDALNKVVNQWHSCLGANQIYPVCTFGYDPDLSPSTELNLRGIEKLRRDIESFLESKQKKLLLARHMSEKRSYAKGIIIAAVGAVGFQAALPGRAAFITATQLAAIASLHYLYKGSVLSKSSAWAVLPVFAGQAIATNVFLFFTSFFPPTGVIEVAAAITAISITSAMLLAVNYALSNGFDLNDTSILKSKFIEYRDIISQMTQIRSIDDLKKLNVEALIKNLT
jgi:small GTP-binding protein